MSKLFDGSDSEDERIKTDNEYAKNYNNWRKKEELHKLQTKYGDVGESSSDETESEDDEDAVELTEKVEKDFFKTLACLKNKDPRIYDDKVRFFDDEEETKLKPEKAPKQKSMFLKDYERKLVLENGGVVSDDEETDRQLHSPTYVEEQKQAKEGLKKALEAINDDAEEEEWGGVFRKRQKTKEESERDEEDYRKWLAGQQNELGDQETEAELKPLKDYWNKPDLDEGEKFLRDFILNKRFLDKDDESYIPTYEEVVHDDEALSTDEETIEKQEEFEHKYNFRYEEPDQEFIKRYPRTIESSLRKTDDKRKLKRQEVKERKKKEKEEKMEDLKQLREYKRKEIEEKLEKLKEITGNATLGFADNDLEGDFDPEEHDKRMQQLFDEEFYKVPEADQKPMFPDIDEELEIENYERFDIEHQGEEDQDLHCEDENFNMDCDYDPRAVETSTKKKRRKRKSKFVEALNKPKPKFDPEDKTYEEYFEEYYKLNCEDFIGDIPCRFKYRKVVPNDFGLSTEEIIMAKERELNKWCSLKKAVQIRSDAQEKYDQIAYKKKAQNLALKKKILPSLYSEENEEETTEKLMEKNPTKVVLEEKKEAAGVEPKVKNEKIAANEQEIVKTTANRKKKKRKNSTSEDLVDKAHGESKKLKPDENIKEIKSEIELKNESPLSDDQTQSEKEITRQSLAKKKKKKRKNSNTEIAVVDPPNTDSLPAKKRKLAHKTEGFEKLKQGKNESGLNGEKTKVDQQSVAKKKKKKRNNKASEQVKSSPASLRKDGKAKKRKLNRTNGKFKKQQPKESKLSTLSDERLKAYGIKPKKFHNKLKYKK